MIIVTSVLALFLLSFIAFLLTKKKYSSSIYWTITDTSLLLAIIFIVIFIFMFIGIPKKRDIEYKISKYENLRAQAEGLTRNDIVDLDNLREEILDMNNDIDKNKIYSKSPWISVFYSEKIGNLQKLTYSGEKK